MSDKPNITELMFLDFIIDSATKEKGAKINGDEYWSHNETCMRSYRLPLSNFWLEDIGPMTQITIPCADSDTLNLISAFVRKRRDAFQAIVFSLTTDPRVETAMDWSDMGEFRVVFKAIAPRVQVKNNRILIQTTPKNKDSVIVREMMIPDRVL